MDWNNPANVVVVSFTYKPEMVLPLPSKVPAKFRIGAQETRSCAFVFSFPFESRTFLFITMSAVSFAQSKADLS